MGHQVDEAHQQESTHTKQHEQEDEQDGGHRLHGVVAQMPLGEAHVQQLPVEVTEGGLSGTQPGARLRLARAGTPQRGAMAPIEKALEGEDRERRMNPERASLELRHQRQEGTLWVGPCSPLRPPRAMPSFLSNPHMPPVGIPTTESQALRAQKMPVQVPYVTSGRSCPGQRRGRGQGGWDYTQGTASEQAFLTLLTPSFKLIIVWPWVPLLHLLSSFPLIQQTLKDAGSSGGC